MVAQGDKAADQGHDAVAAVFARHDWAGPLAKVLRGLWADAYVVGWLSSGSALAHHGLATKADTDVAQVSMGIDWGGWSPGDTDAAKQILGRDDALGHLLSLVDSGDAVADSIVVTRMDRLATALISGLEAGDAPATIARRLEDILGDRRWAHLVALTETTRAVSAATLQRYARNGVQAKEWMTAGDQHVCVPCNVNEDQGAIPLDQPFADGNVAPPSHPLCRCAIAPAWLTADEAAAQGAELSPLSGFSEADLAGVVARAAQDILAESEIEPAAAGAGVGPAPTGVTPLPAVDTRPELAEARTGAAIGQAFMREAERITGRTGVRDRVLAEFKGSLQTAREHAEGLLRGLERFPEADLFGVEAVPLEDASYAEADGGIIRFNTQYTNQQARGNYLMSLRVGRATRWHPAGMDSPVGIAIHEFGHVIDIETLGEVARADIRQLVKDAADRAGVTMREIVSSDVSRYAAEDPRELAAEAFADVLMNGEAASKLSRDIYRVLRDRYEAGGRVLNDTPRVIARASADASDLSRLRVADLRALAKDRGLTGYSKLTKPQLLDLLGRDVEGAAVSRQVEIDAARNLADTLAEVHELVANGGSDRALAHRIAARAKLTGVDVSSLLAKVGDRQALLAEVDRMAQAGNLTRLGEVSTGEVGPVPFNRQAHELLGPGLEQGTAVDVVRPGFSVRLRSGEELTVRPPVVIESTRPLPATTLPTAEDRAALRAAARERNRLIESATKVADTLAELDELVAKKAGADVIGERLAYARSTGVLPAKDLDALARVAGDPAKLRAAVTRIGKRNGLTFDTAAGQSATFSPASHEPVATGLDIAEGAKVTVVRRGATLTLPDGSTMQLTRAQVRTVEESWVEAMPTLQQVASANMRAQLEAGLDRPRIGKPVRLSGGQSADAQLVDTGNGPFVEKRYGTRYGQAAAELKYDTDAEVLGPRILDAMGGRGAATVRTARDSVAVEFLQGEQFDAYTGTAADRAEIARLADTTDGRINGLMSYVTAHADLNDGNWIRLTDGRVGVFDFPGIFSTGAKVGEYGLTEVPNNSFTEYLTGRSMGTYQSGALPDRIDWNPADLAIIRARLKALQPDFVAAKRTTWFKTMMRRLAEIEKRADPSSPRRLS